MLRAAQLRGRLAPRTSRLLSLQHTPRTISSALPPHLADPWSPPVLEEHSNHVDLSSPSLRRHWEDSWDAKAIRTAQRDHVCATWAPGSTLDDVPIFVRGEGIHLFTADGRRFIDWTSQAICTNLGHTVPPAVAEAVSSQLDAVAHVYGGLGLVESRVRLCVPRRIEASLPAASLALPSARRAALADTASSPLTRMAVLCAQLCLARRAPARAALRHALPVERRRGQRGSDTDRSEVGETTDGL